jgi:hypothetical protein
MPIPPNKTKQNKTRHQCSSVCSRFLGLRALYHLSLKHLLTLHSPPAHVAPTCELNKATGCLANIAGEDRKDKGTVEKAKRKHKGNGGERQTSQEKIEKTMALTSSEKSMSEGEKGSSRDHRSNHGHNHTKKIRCRDALFCSLGHPACPGGTGANRHFLLAHREGGEQER